MIKLRFLLIVILFFIGIIGCSAEKVSQAKSNKISGMSAVVGNEPFARIALIVYPHKVYLINGPQEIKQKLIDHQGMYFNIKYSEIRDSANVHVINAYEAALL